MNRIQLLIASLLTVAALGAIGAPEAKADGFYVGGTYTSPRGAYWDPACGCWVYPRYTYRPAYVHYPTYATYHYPRYSYPYYSRPGFSAGFSIGRGGIHIGGYGGRRWYR